MSGRHGRGNSHISTGLVLIGVGVVFLLERQGLLDRQQLIHLWPLLITVAGVARMAAARHANDFFGGAFLVFLSGWLYASLEHLWGLSFHNSWPLLLIAAGVSKVLSGIWHRSDKDEVQP